MLADYWTVTNDRIHSGRRVRGIPRLGYRVDLDSPQMMHDTHRLFWCPECDAYTHVAGTAPIIAAPSCRLCGLQLHG